VFLVVSGRKTPTGRRVEGGGGVVSVALQRKKKETDKLNLFNRELLMPLT
jgi:hypothetical protein